MVKERLISKTLAAAAVQNLATRTGLYNHEITTEFQDDFQFLLVTLPYKRLVTVSQEERKQLGLELDQMMPKREGELTWMLNFIDDGKVVDSYFGGDSTSPDIGF